MLKGSALGVLLIIVVSTIVASVIMISIATQTDYVTYASGEIGDLLTLRLPGASEGEEPEESIPPEEPPSTDCDSQCKIQFGVSYSGECITGTVSPSGMLHVCGTKLCDENGNVVHLKGTLVDWNERRKKKGSPGSTTMALSISEAFFQEDDVILMKSYGANCFEVHVDPFNDWTTTIGNLDTTYFTNWMDHWVNWATNNQMYVILDIGPFREQSSWVIPSWIWSAAGYAQPTTKEEWDKVIRDFFDNDVTAMSVSRQGFIDVWKKVALRYIDNPYVIFSIMDEPLNGVDITGMGAHLGQTYSKFMTDVVDGIRSTGSNHIIIIDRPWVCFHPPNYYDNIQPVNRDGIAWRGAAYMSETTDFTNWCTATDKMINRFIGDFGKPYFDSGFGFAPIQDGKEYYPTTWIGLLEDQINYLISKEVCGRNYHAWGFLEGEVYDWVYNYFRAEDSDYILQTVFGGATTEACQSGETQIDDTCPSGQICCCSGTAPPPGECTPGNDIIQRTEYPSGSCSSTSTLKWSHSTCGQEVCHQGNCRNVDADIISYTAPSGKIARSDTMSIPYTIKNTGDIQWCFMTETALTESDSSKHWIKEFNSVTTGSSATDSISYQISCSDPLGSWSGSLYTTTDFLSNGGWLVWGSVNYNFQVVECLNDQDCVNCKGSGYTCVSNICKSSTPPPSPPSGTLQNCVWMIPYKYLPWKGYYPGGLGNELDNPQYMIDKLDGLNINCIGVHGGSWKSDGTIAYDTGTTFAMWTNFINAIKDWNPNIKILVWVIAWDTADLSDPNIRDKMYDSAEYLLNSVPFDGWNDDYEGWSGDPSDIVTFWQGLASRVKSMGKLATVATEVEWGGWHIEEVYPYLTNFDYIMPMYYAKISTANAADYWNRVLSNSPVPVIMGLAVLLKQNGGTPFSEQLIWIDTQSHSNLAGFGIWAYDYMSYEDLEAWDNWPTKNIIGS
jgi:hypothetical protein